MNEIDTEKQALHPKNQGKNLNDKISNLINCIVAS